MKLAEFAKQLKTQLAALCAGTEVSAEVQPLRSHKGKVPGEVWVTLAYRTKALISAWQAYSVVAFAHGSYQPAETPEALELNGKYLQCGEKGLAALQEVWSAVQKTFPGTYLVWGLTALRTGNTASANIRIPVPASVTLNKETPVASKTKKTAFQELALAALVNALGEPTSIRNSKRGLVASWARTHSEEREALACQIATGVGFFPRVKVERISAVNREHYNRPAGLKVVIQATSPEGATPEYAEALAGPEMYYTLGS